MKQNDANARVKAWLSAVLAPYRKSIVWLTVLTVLVAVFSLAFAYLTRFLINGALEGKRDVIFFFSCVFVGLILCKILFRALNRYFAERTRAKITCDLRKKVFTSVLNTPYQKIERYHTGDLLNRATADVAEIAGTSVALTPAVVGMLVECVGGLVALATIDWLFTLLFVVGAGCIGILNGVFRKSVKRHHKNCLQVDGTVKGYMQETFASALTVKAYGAEEIVSQKADVLLQDYYKTRMRRNLFKTVTDGVFSLIGNFGVIFAVVWCSVSLMIGRTTDYGAMLSVVLLLSQLQHPTSSFSAVMPAYYARVASAERIVEIIESAVSTTSMQSVVDFEGLTLSSVSFSYGEKDVLSGVNLTIEKGEKICIAGPSGEGKSTLIKLLLGVYAPKTGEILLNTNNGDHALEREDFALFAYVPQGNFLFSGTVRENVTAFSKADVLDAEIQRALTIANAEFVYDLPNGLDTVLAERGGGLSEGQIQRLAICRALLSGRKILLLDEATSALDESTERNVLTALKAEKEYTCLLVSHRGSVNEIFDTSYFLADGTLQKR